jgi:site-specific DNA recombinase
MLTMMGGVAEFFSDQLAVHVSKAQRYRASIGLPVGSVPFGYSTLEPGGVPQTEKMEAAAMREVFEHRAEGQSTGAIASWLNGRGFKTLKGGIFTSHAIKDMLNCRFYLGRVSYHTRSTKASTKQLSPKSFIKGSRPGP